MKLRQTIVLMCLLCSPSSFASEPTSASPKMLVVHFFGASEKEHGRSLVDAWLEDSAQVKEPAIHQIRVSALGESEERWDATRFTNEGIIVEVIVDYSPETQQQQRLGHDPYPGEYPYDPETVQLMDRASSQVATMLGELRKLYPDAIVAGFAAGLGIEVLLRTLEKQSIQFNGLMLYYPPISTVKDSASLLDALKGQRLPNATVMAYHGDPTIPYLMDLKRDHVDLFKFNIIQTAPGPGQLNEI